MFNRKLTLIALFIYFLYILFYIKIDQEIRNKIEIIYQLNKQNVKECDDIMMLKFELYYILYLLIINR